MTFKAARLLWIPTASGSLLFSSLIHSQRSDCAAPPNGQPLAPGAFTYPANNPTEDRHVYGSFGSWKYSAVFDGHGGWQVADAASKKLLRIVQAHLNDVNESDEVKIDSMLSKSFVEMENSIVADIKPAFDLGFGDVAKVGSCVLLALQRDRRLIIANCGDCRAVLGSGEHAAVLNRDHNCREPLEQALLAKAHPNEPNLVVCKSSRACYVKGRLQLTRSLGDEYLKSAQFNGPADRSTGRHIPAPYTPPYLSHLPEVHHIRLSDQDEFVILGTDGLWDYLPATEAVQLVQRAKAANMDAEAMAKVLVERALQIAAKESGMSTSELLQLPQGRARRGRHDDTTAVVMFFQR